METISTHALLHHPQKEINKCGGKHLPSESFKTAANSLDKEKRQLRDVAATFEQAHSSFCNMGGVSDGDGDDEVDKNAYASEFARLKT